MATRWVGLTNDQCWLYSFLLFWDLKGGGRGITRQILAHRVRGLSSEIAQRLCGMVCVADVCRRVTNVCRRVTDVCRRVTNVCHRTNPDIVLRKELRDSTDLCPDLSCLTTNRVELVVAWREERVFSLSGTHMWLYKLWIAGGRCWEKPVISAWLCDDVCCDTVLARTLYKHRTAGGALIIKYQKY